MNYIYKSKVDTWLLIFILTPILFILFFDFSIINFFIILFVFIFLLYLLYGINYIITDRHLIIKCGFISFDKFIIDDIQSIKSTKTFLSAPAASLDRLEIQLCNDTVIISPKDKYSFIEKIKEQCSHEINICI